MFELDVHGTLVRVKALDALSGAVRDAIARDFGYFESELGERAPVIEVELNGSSAPDRYRPQGRAAFRSKMCAVYGFWGRSRTCDYGNGSLVRATHKRRKHHFEVFAANYDELYEIAYTVLLSAIGEELDRRGYHRVHALGVEKNGEATLVILPQGGGKSAMAALLLGAQAARLYSDETPLIRGRTVYPFPVRMALAPDVADALGLLPSDRVFRRKLFPEKCLYGVNPRQVARPAQVGLVTSGTLVDSRLAENVSGISLGSRWTVFLALWRHMVVGLGVAQMAEHMLRGCSLGTLLLIAFMRLRTAVELTLKSKTGIFRLEKDARVNAKILTSKLEPADTPAR